MKICSKCGRINEDHESKCIGCGEALVETVKKGKKKSAKHVDALKNCPNCGQIPRAWDRYCGKCGTELTPTQPWPTRKICKRMVVLMTGMVLVICAGSGVKKIVKKISSANTEYRAVCMNVDGKYGYIDERGNVVVDFQYDVAYPFDANGYAQVGIKEAEYSENASIQYGVIDTMGKEVVLCENSYISDKCDEFGYFSIERYDDINETYIEGVANVDGNVMIYSDINVTINIGDSGYFIASNKGHSEYGIINSDREWVLAPEYSYLTLLTSEDEPIKINGEYALLAVDDNYNNGIVSISNEILLPFEYSYIYGFTGNDKIVVYASRNDGMTGIFDTELKEIIPFKYSHIDVWSEAETMIASIDDEYYIINLNGKELYLPDVDFAWEYENKFWSVLVNEQAGVINENGEWIINPVFDYVAIFDKYIIGYEYDGYENQVLYDCNGKQYALGENQVEWAGFGCEDAIVTMYEENDEITYGSIKVTSDSVESITAWHYEYYDWMNGWIALYDYGYQTGCLISPAGEIVSDVYTRYFMDEESEYITAWEQYSGDMDGFSKSYLLDKNGKLIKTFENYRVGVFKKVR